MLMTSVCPDALANHLSQVLITIGDTSAQAVKKYICTFVRPQEGRTLRNTEALVRPSWETTLFSWTTGDSFTLSQMRLPQNGDLLLVHRISSSQFSLPDLIPQWGICL